MNDLGLSTAEAKKKLAQYGLNEISEKKTNKLKKIFAPLYSPISLMLLGAAALSFFNGKFFPAYFILFLYFVNYFIQKWQEFKADKAIDKLREKLFFNVSTKRDGEWKQLNAKLIVPGDVIRLGLGSIIPADASILSSRNLMINEAVLTGESLPKEKKEGDKIFSGSFISTGSIEAKVESTGKNTYFGKTFFSIDASSRKSILETDILFITRFLTTISIVAVVILTTVFLFEGFPIGDLLTLDLSLIIAGIPIALPAVMAIILSIGAAGLAKKDVIVRRLSALQDLANVNLLLSDKTGTLTKNEIEIVNVISYQRDLSVDDIVELANYATLGETPSPIDLAIKERFKKTDRTENGLEVLNFVPYDSDRKRTTVLVKKDDKTILISLGASQIIQSFDTISSGELKKKFTEDIKQAANNGFRVLALAIKKGGKEEKQMKIVGLLFLADPLDEGSKETLKFVIENGISVKMVTGDNRVIAERIAKELNLQGKILPRDEIDKFFQKKDFYKDFDDIAGFAEILPKDKYEIVKKSKKHYIVASTGDGINDLPALKIANVGIAVSGSVSALKSMADIVLLGQGLSVITNAILESRKIFTRLYNYSVYRISESFRLIITILVIGLFYKSYPLVPLQLIILALLNDIPIISLAVDRVRLTAKPSEIKARERLVISLLFGLTGILESLVFFFLTKNLLNIPLPIIQTMFFLKLTVSGHALIYVAHTKERWWKFLPSKEVIWATTLTQFFATILTLTGLMMPSKISFTAVLFVWIWSLLWMQIAEFMKVLQKYLQ